MKGVTKTIALLVMLGAASILLVACNNIDGNTTTLDPAIETQMKIDWHEQFGFPFYFDAYYGTFNGAVVVFVAGDASVVTERTIAGVTFTYVWSNNKFFSLSEAYPEILTQSNVVAIHNAHIQNTIK